MVTTPLFLTHGYGPPNDSINPCLQARIFNKDLYNYLFGRFLQYSAMQCVLSRKSPTVYLDFVLFIILNFTLWTVNEQGQKIFWLSGAGDWIALTIGIIGAVVTAELGYIAVWQNEQQAISSNEYQRKQNELSQLEVAQNEKNEIKKVIELNK